MSIWNKIKKVTNRILSKISQVAEYLDFEESQDPFFNQQQEIDPERFQEGEEYKEQNLRIIREISDYFLNLNPQNPTDVSTLPPLSEKWKTKLGYQNFQQIAYEALSTPGVITNTGFNDNIIDEILNNIGIVNGLVAPPKNKTKKPFKQPIVSPDIHPDVKDVYDVVKEDPEFAQIIPEYLWKHPAMTPEKMELLKKQLKGIYKYEDINDIKILPPDKKQDVLQVYCPSPQSDLFIEEVMQKDNIAREKLINFSQPYEQELYRRLRASNVKFSQDDISGSIFSELMTPPLGCIRIYNPKTGQLRKGVDYVIEFFLSQKENEQFLPKGVTIDDVINLRGPEPKDKKSIDKRNKIRVKLMTAIDKLIKDGNDTLLHYLLNKATGKAFNTISQATGSEYSLDYEVGEDISLKEYVQEGDQIEHKQDIVQDSEENIPKSRLESYLRWDNVVRKYAPEKYGGQGNVFSRIKEQFGNDLINNYNKIIYDLQKEGGNEGKIRRCIRQADMIDVLLFLAEQQVDNLFNKNKVPNKSDQGGKTWSLRNNNGGVTFWGRKGKGDENTVKGWRNIVSADYIFDVEKKICELKDAIYHYKKLGINNTQEIIKRIKKEQDDSISDYLLTKSDFVKRTLSVSPPDGDQTLKGDFDKKMDKIKKKVRDKRQEKGLPPLSDDELEKEVKFLRGKTIRASSNIFYKVLFPLLVSTLVNRQKELENKYADNPKLFKVKKEEFEKMRRFFMDLIGVHSKISIVDEKKWKSKIEKAKKQGNLSKLLGNHVANALSYLMYGDDYREKGKMISNRDAFLMICGYKPLPRLKHNIDKEGVPKVITAEAFVEDDLSSSISLFKKFAYVDDIEETIKEIRRSYENYLCL
ncbi:MAG: hypothetical protein ACOC5T_03045 [Elusimicrobiota bacterium]